MARRGKKKAAKPGQSGMPGGAAPRAAQRDDDGDHDGDVDAEDRDRGRTTRGPQVPPPVEWDVPPVPLRWLEQQHTTVSAKVVRAERKGDSSRLEEAKAEQQRLGSWLKQAGRSSDSGLEFKVKSEKTKIAKADKAVQKIRDTIKDRQGKIDEIQAEIEELRQQESHHLLRRGKLSDKVAYLSAQLHAEAMPKGREEQLQACRARMEEYGDPVFRVALEMLATMLPPSGAARHNMADGDSTASDATDLDGMASDDDDEPGGDAGADVADDGADDLGLRAQIGDARNHLDRLRHSCEAALANARAARKRSADGEEKDGDADGDEGMLPILSVAQVEELFGPQVRDAEAKLARLEWLAASRKESLILVPQLSIEDGIAPSHGLPSSSSTSDPRVGTLHQAEHRPQHHQDSQHDGHHHHQQHHHCPPHGDAFGGGAAKRLEATTVTAEARDARAAGDRIEAARAEEAAEHERACRVNAIIEQQEKEQAESDEQAERVRLAANDQKADVAVANRPVFSAAVATDVLVAPAAYGPAGAPPAEQQRNMRRNVGDGSIANAAASAAAPPVPRGRPSRWDKQEATERETNEPKDDRDEGARERSKTPRAVRRASGAQAADADMAD